MTFFLIALKKCPKCKKYGVVYGHFGYSKTDGGWLGLKCVECGWMEKDEKNTKLMLGDFRKLRDFAEKKLGELGKQEEPQPK